MQLMDQKRKPVRGFIYSLCGRLPCPMSSACLDANQDGCRTSLRRLQSGGIFKAVPGHHAVVMIGSGNQGRRIMNARPNVVEWRVGIERFELLRILGRSIITLPHRADGEL